MGAIELTRNRLAAADRKARAGAGLWLRTLDRLGLGFDSSRQTAAVTDEGLFAVTARQRDGHGPVGRDVELGSAVQLRAARVDDDAAEVGGRDGQRV